MSYCNTGFSILGRVIEVVTDEVWEALLHRTAVGHIKPDPSAALEVAPVWTLPRACGPMGLINSTVGDDLTRDGDRLVGTVTESGPLASLTPDPVTAVTLTPVDASAFLVHGALTQIWAPMLPNLSGSVSRSLNGRICAQIRGGGTTPTRRDDRRSPASRAKQP
jgi:hypothetical protein